MRNGEEDSSAGLFERERSELVSSSEGDRHTNQCIDELLGSS